MPKDEINLAKKIKEEERSKIAGMICSDYDNDCMSREPWEKRRNNFYKLWMGKRDPKNTPWPGASNVCLPMLATACNQFHARAYTAMTSPIKPMQVIPVEKNDVPQAKRIEQFMNWQIQFDMDTYEEETDKLLLGTPINGGAFKKIQFDRESEKPVAEYVPIMDIVLPYRSKSIETARHAIHRIRKHYDEIAQRADDRYIDFDKVSNTAGLDVSSPEIEDTKDELEGEPVDNDQRPKLILEDHRWHKMPWDSRPAPYIITVDYDSKTMLRSTSRVVSVGGKEHVLNHLVDYHFIPNPEGFYPFGFGHFLEHLNEMANTAFNQIFDSGRLANQPFGFYGRRAGVKRKTIELHPGLMTEVEDASQIFFPNMQRIDQTLFQVLGLIQQYVEQYTSTSDYLVGREARGTKTPTATGTLAIIEQGLVLYSTMIKRLFRSQRKEFRLLYALNRISLPKTKQYFVLGTTNPSDIAFPDIKRKDFDGRMHIIPVGDPTYASRQQRRQEAQELLAATLSNPLVINSGKVQIVNPKAVWNAYRNLYETYERRDVMSLLPPEPPDPPLAPEAENALFMQGDFKDPIPGEDHVAHLEIHERFKTGPLYEEMPEDRKKLMSDHITKTKALYQQEQMMKTQMGAGSPTQEAPAGIPEQSPLEPESQNQEAAIV